MYPTGGSDYTLDQISLTFQDNATVIQELCIPVNITDDDLTERNETFNVVFTAAAPDIIEGGSNITITIIDGDGECILN